MFADGQVQIVEFEVPVDADPQLSTTRSKNVDVPAESRVLGILREDGLTLPGAPT